jgi:hypothetical protein
MFIPGLGSDFFPSRIPDPNFFPPGSQIRIKEFKYFNPKKWFLSSRKYDPGCSSRIRVLTFYPSRIPDPGVKRHRIPDPDPQHCCLQGKQEDDSAVDYNDDADLLTDFFFTDADLKVLSTIFDKFIC